jgi:hypothetical protein
MVQQVLPPFGTVNKREGCRKSKLKIEIGSQNLAGRTFPAALATEFVERISRSKGSRGKSDTHLDSTDLKSFPLQHRSYPSRLIALDFNGSSPHGSSATAASPNPFGKCLDHGERQMTRELVDDDDGLSAAVSRFSTQHDAAQLPEGRCALFSRARLIRAFWQVHLRKHVFQLG